MKPKFKPLGPRAQQKLLDDLAMSAQVLRDADKRIADYQNALNIKGETIRQLRDNYATSRSEKDLATSQCDILDMQLAQAQGELVAVRGANSYLKAATDEVHKFLSFVGAPISNESTSILIRLAAWLALRN